LVEDRAKGQEGRSSAESSAELNSRVHVSTPAAAQAAGLRLPLRRRRRRERAKRSTASPIAPVLVCDAQCAERSCLPR
jgi:hypothetical protein